MNTGYDEEEDAEGLGASESPDESDWCDSEDAETLSCPECGKEVYEHADRCPSCGSFIIPVAPGRPLWIVLAALAVIGGMLAGMLIWVVRR